MTKLKLFKDKRGLEIKSAFFAIVVVSAMIIAVGVLIGEWNTSYSSGLTYDLGDLEKLDEVSAEASKQQGNVSVTSSVQGEDFEGTSIRAVFGFLNNIFKPFRVVFGNGGMIDSLTDRFGIPDFVRQTLVTLMVFALTWAMVAIFFRRGQRSV